MVLTLIGVPPPLRSCGSSWRQLYEMGCFFQRELEEEGVLSTEARKRGFTMSQVAPEEWERWDELGVLHPIGFSKTAYISRGGMAALPPECLIFRDEQAGFEPWENYAWDADGYPHVTALFSQWQLMMVADAVEGGSMSVPLEVLLRDSGREEWAESFRGFFEEKHRQWTHVHEWWDPTLRQLVRLQNRYWPAVKGRSRVLLDAEGNAYDPDAGKEFDAQVVLDELALAREDIVAGYEHLARRGHELEFGDRLYLLRQMVPRARRRGFENWARRAQDFYDAAEVLRRFYRDLTGEVLPDAGIAALAHNAEELETLSQRRNQFLGHEPRLRYDAEDAKRVLSAVGIYPHGVHVIVEGESEEELVKGLVRELLGPSFLDDLVLTNIRGVGGATRIEQLLAAVTDYALRTVLIVDNEGGILPTVELLIADGLLDRDDVLVQDTSMEESNVSDEELVDIAKRVATTPTDKRPAATLILTAQQLRSYHDDRVQRSSSKDRRGLADSLLTLAEREEHGSVRLSKPELAEGILNHVHGELTGARNWEELDQAATPRPIVSHIVQRVVKPLLEALPDRLRRRRT